MNKNIGGTVSWINNEDYVKAGGIAWNESYGANDKGPLTALKYLEERTKNWTNIPKYNYDLVDDRPDKLKELYSTLVVKYQPIKRIDVRARLANISDIIDFTEAGTKNLSAPYLYDNLSSIKTEQQPYGYWLSTASPGGTYAGFSIIYSKAFTGYTVDDSNDLGIRPVIKVSKLQLY